MLFALIKLNKEQKMKNFVVVGLISSIIWFSSQKTYANEFETLQFNGLEQKLFVDDEKINFYLFASFGLNDTTLRQMLDYAKIYNGVIVLRGIEDNSFKTTAEHIQKLASEGEEVAIIIDPTLFKQYQVTQVPAYVLARQAECPVGMSCKARYDKITGNITPKYALEKFVEKGELASEATKLLGATR